MVASSKLQKLMKVLVGATLEGSIRWHRNGDEHIYRTELKRGSVSVEEDGDFSYVVTLYDGDHNILELEIFNSGNPDHLLAANLHEAARRSGLGVDDLIESFIDEVESKRPLK